MPVKILLADKSITIQKVVEMLFSGREYEVTCVSDGETALHEAERLNPDVVLADVDLPRVDGYSLSMRLKKTATLARIPIILMMSRDDVYDNAKGNQAGIIDKIVKPFESQELIGKVKKALTSAPPRPVEPTRAVPAAPQPAAPAPPRAVPYPPPTDIFDIISGAPTHAELKQPAPAGGEETVYEVEPVVEEVEAPRAREEEKVLPTGARAVEEMRASLGLVSESQKPQPEVVSFDSFDIAIKTEKTLAKSDPTTLRSGPLSSPQAELPTDELRKIVEETVSRMATDVFRKLSPSPPPAFSEETMLAMAAEAVSKMAANIVKDIEPPSIPKISDETIRRGIQEAVEKVAREIAREVIEQVAWEVVPQLAEQLIQEEIERLKIGT